VKLILGCQSSAEPMAKPTSKNWFRFFIYWEEEVMPIENWLSGKTEVRK